MPLSENSGAIQANLQQKVPVPSVISELLATKRLANKSPRYLRNLEYDLEQFAAAHPGFKIDDFRPTHIEDWIGRYENPWTRQSWYSRLSTLFGFAAHPRRRYIERNPVEFVERPVCDGNQPRILTPQETQKLLESCPFSVRPYFILATFAGMRPEEIVAPKRKGLPGTRLKWSAANLEAKFVEAFGKRRRRLVSLEEKAVQLLAQSKNGSQFLAPSHSVVRRWHKKARAVLGLKRFPQDLLRHTAASYLFALIGDYGKVAARCGNTEKILKAHYIAPVTPADCLKFWSCAPTPDSHNDEKQLQLGL